MEIHKIPDIAILVFKEGLHEIVVSLFVHTMEKREAYLALEEALQKSNLNLKLSFVEKKRDPVLLARAKILRGFIYFEYAQGCAYPCSAHLVSKLGDLRALPIDNEHSIEVNELFIPFSFCKNFDDLVAEMEEKLRKTKQLFSFLFEVEDEN